MRKMVDYNRPLEKCKDEELRATLEDIEKRIAEDVRCQQQNPTMKWYKEMEEIHRRMFKKYHAELVRRAQG